MADTVRISSDASFEAVRRQVGLNRSGRLILELPDGWTELDNLARMRLLQRQAQIQGSDIALITRHEATRKAAKQAGIPVFYRSQDAAKRNWQMDPLLPLIDPQQPEKNLPEPPPWRRQSVVDRETRPSRFRSRQRRIQAEERYRRPLPVWVQWLSPIFMGGLIGILLIGFLLYVLPAATVTLVPGRDTLSVSVPLTANTNLDVPDYETATIPARLVETTIEEFGTIATTGSQQKATEKATGQVVFSNLGNAAVRVPVGTVVSTSSGTPVTFATTNVAELPGGVGQRVSVPVEAVEPGVVGNVRSNTINTVSGALRFRARASNDQPTFGGGSALVPVVTQADQDQLLAQLRDSVTARAGQALQEELEEGEWLPPETVQTYVIAQVFDQFEDDEADQLGLTLRLLVQGIAVEADQMNEAMLAAIQSEAPAQGQIVADTFSAQRTGDATLLGRSAQFTTTASADYVIPIDVDAVRSEIAGLTEAEAAALLQSNWQIAGQPDIYRDPAWLSTLPRFPSRIQVRVEYGDTVAAEIEE